MGIPGFLGLDIVFELAEHTGLIQLQELTSMLLACCAVYADQTRQQVGEDPVFWSFAKLVVL